MSEIKFCLGWDTKCDIDASIITLDSNAENFDKVDEQGSDVAEEPMDCVDESASEVDIQEAIKIEQVSEEKESLEVTCLVCYKNLPRILFEDHLATAHNSNLEMYTDVLGEPMVLPF